MIDLSDLLRTIAGRLAAQRARWAVIGGLAVSVRAAARFTQDADIAVAVANDAEAERLIGAVAVGSFQIQTIVEQTATGRLATVRLSSGPYPTSPLVDLLFASSGIEPEIVAAADLFEVFPGFKVPVAQTGHLIALKVLSRDDDTRPQDTIDLHTLLVRSTPDDLAMARTALDLIAERGYARGKNLQGDLDVLLARFRPSE